jgi:hypothetical protein
MIDITAMAMGYVECMLWSSTDENGVPLDDDYFPTDLAPETQQHAREDCAEFIRTCEAQGITQEALRSLMDSSRCGHDLWLTRNRHGAGFWDRGYGDVGDKLTTIAHEMGSRDAYVGDDGKVYTS